MKRIIYFFYPINYKNTIWLIGAGRSGTTWVSSLINYRNSYRELFEPFHTKIPEMYLMGFKKNLFLNEEGKRRWLRFLIKKVLQGKFYHPRVERSNKFINFYGNDFLLVKDIFVNLIAYEVCTNNSKVKPILLIRNPFAVALSVRERKNWSWMTDPKEFLLQKELFENYLKPFNEIILDISANGSYLDKQILIWSIINYIPLLQFTEKKLLVTFYEDWLLNPEQELKKVQNYLNIPIVSSVDIKNSKKFKESSRTSSKKEFEISSWNKKISIDEIKSGMKILKKFGLENLYDEFSRPNHDLIQQILLNKTKMNNAR